MSSPFHAGERAVHARLGLDMEVLGRRMIGGALTGQHREFFAGLSSLVVGAVVDGQPWATIVAGAPGFVRAEGDRRLRIEAAFADGDPAAVSVGGDVGLLGIELPTRRRNRVNGRAGERTDAGFTVEVVQAFGNCPRYIEPRAEPLVRPGRVEGLAGVDTDAVERADTCFVATWSGEGGADVSHRGGPPGFVRVDGPDRLWIPDYPGNNLFLTLGNLVAHPRAGLVFPDFGTGGLLQLAGRAEIVWGPERGWWLWVEAARRHSGDRARTLD